MGRSVIAVYSTHRHPRLRYVLSEAGRRLGCNFQLFTDYQKYLDASCRGRIYYTKSTEDLGTVAATTFIYAHPFLAGKEASESDLSVRWGSEGFRLQGSSVKPRSNESGSPAFFSCPEQIYYDPFSVIFYCLSRYEEYQPFTTDDHGRFPASASHAYANSYLSLPLVDYLLAELAGQLGLTTHAPPFYRATYDVDVPFAYRLRGWRGIASGVKDLLTGKARRASARFATLWLGKPDPYDTFNQLRDLHAAAEERPRVFFLLAAKRSTYDPNPSPKQSAYQDLIRSVAEWAEVGIHPSYYSADQAGLFEAEKASLRAITNGPVTHSRQHFLRFALPETYRELIRTGITNDHSMGYAAEIGWRAGTNQSFYWYDLEREQKTHLLIHPFGAMEVTLLRYQNLATLKSKAAITQLYTNLSPLGGPLTLLWHNSSFADDFGWKDWWEMYAGFFSKKPPVAE